MDPVTLFAAGVALIPGVGEYAAQAVPVVLTVVAVSAAVAPYMKPPIEAKGGIYPWLYAIVNFLAQNFRHARNAPPARKE